MLMNGKYRTERTRKLEGPLLITYVYRNSMVWALFQQGGHPAAKIEVRPGLFVPKGAQIDIDGEEAIISYVEPADGTIR